MCEILLGPAFGIPVTAFSNNIDQFMQPTICICLRFGKLYKSLFVPFVKFDKVRHLLILVGELFFMLGKFLFIVYLKNDQMVYLLILISPIVARTQSGFNE